MITERTVKEERVTGGCECPGAHFTQHSQLRFQVCILCVSVGVRETGHWGRGVSFFSPSVKGACGREVWKSCILLGEQEVYLKELFEKRRLMETRFLFACLCYTSKNYNSQQIKIVSAKSLPKFYGIFLNQIDV